MPRDIPILFSGPMVRALLDGRKTMTRRLAWKVKTVQAPDGTSSITSAIPTIWQKVEPGDRLWVRETFATTDGGPTRYYATDDVHELRRKRPAIHMPRARSRLTAVVTETKTERLQAIMASEADAKAEGVMPADCEAPFWAFRDLWNTLHKPDNQWKENPEVVALTFTVHKANIDETAAP